MKPDVNAVFEGGNFLIRQDAPDCTLQVLWEFVCVCMYVCAHFHEINSFSCYSRHRPHKSGIHSRNAARNLCYVSSCRCFEYHWTCDPGLAINLPLKIKPQVTEWH